MLPHLPQTRSPSPLQFSFNKPTHKPSLTQRIQLSSNQTIRKIDKEHLAMWLATITQPHSKQFPKALQQVGAISIVSIDMFIRKNYGHIQQVARLYIMAAINDYGLLTWTPPTHELPMHKQEQLFFVVQEIVYRFFRELQWFYRIKHIPVYAIFKLLDPFGKGYISYGQIKSYIKLFVDTSGKQKINKNCMKLIIHKLKNNLGVNGTKIHQQNVEQLLLRTMPSHTLNVSDTSQVYKLINEWIEKGRNNFLHIQQQRCQQQAKDSLQTIRKLQLAQEDAIIKQKSLQILKPPSSYAYHSHQPILGIDTSIPLDVFQDKVVQYDRKQTQMHRSTNKGQENDQKIIKSPYSSQFSGSHTNSNTAKKTRNVSINQVSVQAKQNNGKVTNRNFQAHHTNHPQYRQNQSTGKKIVAVSPDKKTEPKTASASSNSKQNLLKNQILKELQYIREQKRKTHSQLLYYI